MCVHILDLIWSLGANKHTHKEKKKEKKNLPSI